MRKISCIIVDDEPMALNLMERYVLRTPFLELKKKCGNAFEVLEHLQQYEAPDLIFSDIQMPELNGMELSKNIPSSTKIIFTTAFEQYAIEGYKVSALDYLLKPIDYAEFLTAAQKGRDWFEKNEKIPQSSANNERDYIFIKSEYKQLKVRFADILYIEGLKDYAKIYLIDEKVPVLSLISLKKLEEELPSDQFMRIHRSFIIAVDKILQIERNQVIIGEKRITIADQYRKSFNDFIEPNSI
ncbi:MAG: LytTR family DNA-binding domain-containing protein [Niabella sp.]